MPMRPLAVVMNVVSPALVMEVMAPTSAVATGVMLSYESAAIARTSTTAVTTDKQRQRIAFVRRAALMPARVIVISISLGQQASSGFTGQKSHTTRAALREVATSDRPSTRTSGAARAGSTCGQGVPAPRHAHPPAAQPHGYPVGQDTPMPAALPRPQAPACWSRIACGCVDGLPPRQAGMRDDPERGRPSPDIRGSRVAGNPRARLALRVRWHQLAIHGNRQSSCAPWPWNTICVIGHNAMMRNTKRRGGETREMFHGTRMDAPTH